MKSSPTKGKLGDFFRGLGREGTEARQEKQVQENQGMTNFEKRQAEKATQRKTGKSKFQRAGAERKAREAATAAGDARNAADKKAREAAKVVVEAKAKEVSTTPKDHSERLMKTFNLSKGDPYTYRYRLGDFGGYNIEFKTGDSDWTVANKRQEKAIEGELHKSRNVKITSNQPSELYDTEDFTYDSPVEKKSPYKKGLGSYAKKAKGNRGYKMKRK
jgi:hypothetical protein